MQKINNEKIKIQKLKIVLTSVGPSPKLAHRLRSEIVRHGPPICNLRVVLLLQHRIHLRHLLLLLKLPLYHILHVSVKRVLDLTSVDF